MSTDVPTVEIPNLDQKIWLVYAKQVSNQLTAGSTLGDNVIFISPPTYVGMGIGNRDEDINCRCLGRFFP